MYRGCSSDTKVSRQECKKRPHMCVLCDENGCNSRTLVTEPTYKCHQCNDTTSCAYGLVDDSTIVTCDMPVLVCNNL